MNEQNNTKTSIKEILYKIGSSLIKISPYIIASLMILDEINSVSASSLTNRCVEKTRACTQKPGSDICKILEYLCAKSNRHYIG